MTGPIVAWRNSFTGYILHGHRCCDCRRVYHPKKYICDCGSRKFLQEKLSGFGKIVTFTTVRNKNRDSFLCVVELDEGAKLVSQITDVDFKKIKIGMRCRAVFRKLYEEGPSGIIRYGIVFVPSASEGNSVIEGDTLD